MHYIFFFILIFTNLNSFAKNCSLSAKGAENNLVNIKTITENYEESPFMLACKEPPELLKGRPKTGLLIRSIVESDSEGNSTREFLKKVIAKARTRVQEGFNQIENISKCMPTKSKECSELNKWVDYDLPEYLKATRYNLSLAQGPHQMKTWFSEASNDLNENLDPLGSYKFEDWTPLAEAERKKAELDLLDYKSQINAEVISLKKQKKISLLAVNSFKNESLLSVRYKHYMTYHQMLAELPILQYLKGPAVSRIDLAKAFEKMKKNLLSENEHLNKMENILNDAGPLPAEILNLLNYNSAVEDLLIENSQYCKLASSLVFTMSDRQFGTSIAIGLPILAVSFFAPPSIALLTGISAGTNFAYKSYSEFSLTQQKALGFIYGDELGEDLKKLDHTSKQMKYELATLPIGLGLGSLITRTVVIGGRSLSIGNKIFKNYRK